MNIINSAGKATRLDTLAPHGCKALTPVAGKPIIEWQLDVLGQATIVCRAEHAPLLERYGPVVTDDRDRGPASCLSFAGDGPVTVVYADSWFAEVPDGSDWVGVWRPAGTRPWDVIEESGLVRYQTVAAVCVGLYSFADGPRARHVADRLLFRLDRPVGMADVLNTYSPWRAVEVPSWRDIGDPDALSSADLMLRGAA